MTLLINGCSFHSHFKANIDPELERGLKINNKSKLANYLMQTELIVMDKATQLH